MSFRARRRDAVKAAIASLCGSQIVRFGIVAVLGMIIDVATGWLLSARAHVPLGLAAAAGFALAAMLNYVLQASWTFAGANGLSARRGGLYLLTLAATLATRLGAVAVLQAGVANGPFKPPLVLVPAIGTSFIVNFLLSKHLVFGARTHRADGQSPA